MARWISGFDAPLHCVIWHVNVTTNGTELLWCLDGFGVNYPVWFKSPEGKRKRDMMDNILAVLCHHYIADIFAGPNTAPVQRRVLAALPREYNTIVQYRNMPNAWSIGFVWIDFYVPVQTRLRGHTFIISCSGEAGDSYS